MVGSKGRHDNSNYDCGMVKVAMCCGARQRSGPRVMTTLKLFDIGEKNGGAELFVDQFKLATTTRRFIW